MITMCIKKNISKNHIYLIYLIYFLMINKKTILLRDIFVKQSVLKILFTHPSNMQHAVVFLTYQQMALVS